MVASSSNPIWIAHVDLDAFFASCEQRDNPEYRGKPVIVGALPGGRGVVAAASYEARKYGIYSAMPIGEAYRRCRDAVYLKPDIAKYSAASKQVFAALANISPAVEKASIDEAYLDISGLEKLSGTPEDIGQHIKDLIKAETGLTASVGIGPNRLIAKLGSDYNKPDGLTVVRPDEVLDFLGPMPVKNLRGNGKQTQKIFAQLSLTTLAQVRAADPDWLAHHLSPRAAASFQRQAQGIASSQIETGRRRKSISKERTFQDDQISADFLHDKLLELSQGVAAIARKEGLAGRVVKLKVRYSDFETLTRQKALQSPTQDGRVLLDTVTALFNSPGLPKKALRLIGVGLSDWQAPVETQTDMFAEPTAHSPSELLKTLDKVAERFGSDKLKIGVGRSK
jgi:DNA polymerase-4